MQRDLSPPPFAFKCRDCGVEVDDPETHKCNPAEILPPAQRKSIRPVNDRQTIFAPSFRLRDLASPTLAPFTTIERNRDTIIADNVDEDKYSSTSSSRRRYDDDYDSRGRSNKYESPRSKYDDYNSRKSDRSRERYDDYGERRDRRTYDDDRSSISQRSRDDKYDNRKYDDRGSYNSRVEDKYGAYNRKPVMDEDSYGMSSSALRHKSSSSTSSNKFNYTSSRQSQPQRYRSRSPSPYSSVDSKRPSASQQFSDEPNQNIPPSTQEADEPKKKFGLDFLANYTKAFFGGSTTQSDGIETEESNHDSSPQSHSTNISADSGYITSNVDNRSSLSSRGYDRRSSKKSLEQFDDIMSELSREMGESSVDDYPVKNSRGRTDNYRDPVPSQSPVPVSLIKIYSSSEKIVCPGCKGLIWRGDDIVSIPASSSFDDETIYHSTCLVCAVCSVSQDRDIERFVVHRGEVYCCIDWKEVGMDKDIDLNKEPRQNLQDDRSRYGRDNDDRRYDSSPKYRDDYDQPKDLYNRNDPNAGYYGSKYDDSERATSRDVGRTSRGRSVDETACATCSRPVASSQAVVNPRTSKAYHPTCLDCTKCGTTISTSPSSTTYPPHFRTNSILCHPCYQASLPSCAACKQTIQRSSKVCVALGKKFHPNCFGCSDCGRKFTDKSFYVFEGEPCCRRCYHERNGSICKSCSEPIEGPCAQVIEGRFHPRCFSCFTCQSQLTDVYYSFENRPYCETHIMEIQRKRRIKVDRRMTYFKNI